MAAGSVNLLWDALFSAPAEGDGGQEKQEGIIHALKRVK